MMRFAIPRGHDLVRALQRELRHGATGAAMSANANQLDSCWDLTLQDTLFDVAATSVATEPGPTGKASKVFCEVNGDMR